MVKNSINMLLVCFITLCVQAYMPLVTDPLSSIYGPTNLNISPSSYQKISALVTGLNRATPEEKKEAIAYVITYLKKTQEAIQHSLNRNNPLLFFKQFMLKHQIHYLENLCNQSKTQEITSLFAQAKNWLFNAFSIHTTSTALGKTLAHQIIDYIEFEREHILYDYEKQLLFFTSLKKTPLPESINFWAQPELNYIMYAYAQQFNQNIVPQFGIDSIIEFAVQGILMAANSMAIEWVEKEDAEQFEKLQKEQNKLQDDWTNFVIETKNQSQKIMGTVVSHFKQSTDALQKAYETNNIIMQREVEYLSRSLNLAQPKTLFLVNSLTLSADSAFEAAPMNTPSPHIWYNIAQKGDWQFDASTNSFWQNGLQPFTADTAELNNIFTEAIINEPAYEIEVECTLYTASAPFFVGVMFNKARWLSGDPERATGYRLLGLYGSQQQSMAIDAVFADQTTIPPLANIITQPSTRLATNVLDAHVLRTDPVTVVFHVVTKPEEVTCTVSHKESSGSLKQLIQKTITGLNKYRFIYHGIGFMAPGCQASFKLLKPEHLRYTAEQLQAYKARS